MSVQNVIQFKVFIVLAQGVVQGLGHPQPAEVEEELDRRDDGIVEVQLGPLVLGLVTARTVRAGLSSQPGHFPDTTSVKLFMSSLESTKDLLFPPEKPLFPYERHSEVEVDGEGDNLQGMR